MDPVKMISSNMRSTSTLGDRGYWYRRDTAGDDSIFLSESAFEWDQGRYRVWLPWKSDCRSESNCYQFCLSRLKQLQGRLQRNPLMVVEYNTMFQKQLQQG